MRAYLFTAPSALKDGLDILPGKRKGVQIDKMYGQAVVCLRLNNSVHHMAAIDMVLVSVMVRQPRGGAWGSISASAYMAQKRRGRKPC